MYRRLGGPQSRFGRGDEEKNFHPLPELDPPTIQAVAQCYTTELPRLLLLQTFYDTYYKRKPVTQNLLIGSEGNSITETT
jgi:hypothetical protein